MIFRVLSILSLLTAEAGAGEVRRAESVESSDEDRRYTVAERVAQFGAAAEGRWKPYFEAAGLPFPPKEVAFVGLKAEGILQIYGRARRGQGSWVWLRDMPILAASGGPGPKLQEGDFQVPEGKYKITMLNPNSRYHLSLRVNYPSPEDKRRAAGEGRKDLGGDIMIHGNAVSIGCLAMGDEGAEDLFILAARARTYNCRVLLSPKDFRRDPAPYKPLKDWPKWVNDLHVSIKSELQQYPLPPEKKKTDSTRPVVKAEHNGG